MKTYIGIDGAKSGAIAILREHEFIVRPVQLYKEGDEEVFDDVWFNELLQAERALGIPITVVVEKAQKFSPGKFALISVWSVWASQRTVLRLGGYHYKAVNPQQWQREMLAGIPRKDPSDTGPASITAAQRLFPGVNLRRSTRCRTDCDGMADALNIAAWAKKHDL